MENPKNHTINRPLDFLDEYRQKSVIVSLKDKNVIKGILKAFDVHINVVLEIDNKTLFIRGDEVLSIENE